MFNKISLPVEDYESLSDDLVRHINDYALTQEGLEIWRLEPENSARLYGELVSKLTGYTISVNKELTHFIFVNDEEAIMFKLRFKE
jgi:hypothetical protein